MQKVFLILTFLFLTSEGMSQPMLSCSVALPVLPIAEKTFVGIVDFDCGITLNRITILMTILESEKKIPNAFGSWLKTTGLVYLESAPAIHYLVTASNKFRASLCLKSGYSFVSLSDWDTDSRIGIDYYFLLEPGAEIAFQFKQMTTYSCLVYARASNRFLFGKNYIDPALKFGGPLFEAGVRIADFSLKKSGAK